jgi:hypothetical protein
MASKKTTHELAKLLEDVVSSLRELPDIPLTNLKEICESKVKNKDSRAASLDLDGLMTKLRQIERDEAENQLNALTNKRLMEFCKKFNIKTGSKQTKSSLVQQILWNLFDAKADLDRITSYQQKP